MGVTEAGAELGALLGEIPAAERGYDGKGFAGVTENAARARDGKGFAGVTEMLRGVTENIARA